MEFLLTGLPHKKREILSQLLPYWGALIDKNNYRIVGALKDCVVSVSGLSESQSEELSRFLRHTGVQIVDQESQATLHISVQLKENAPAPITLYTDKANYHLKPLRKQTDDVQTWIHKRLWLPVREPSFTITIHDREQNNIPEWLCYLIIQYFMQPSLKRLTSVSLSDYQSLTASMLRFLNNDLANCQLVLEQPAKEEWPMLPPHTDQQTHDNPAENKAGKLNPFDHSGQSPEAAPINPFRREDSKQRSTINPFIKNKPDPK